MPDVEMTDAARSPAPPPPRAIGEKEEPRIYHERQEMLLCGLHALNALLQGPHFDEISLAMLAQDLDKKEREVMAEAGLESAEFQKFVAEGSANVANDGNFSIQVLTMALNLHGLSILNIDSPSAQSAKENPQQEQAFICHLKAHWFCIRKVSGEWYDLNSLHAAPKALSEFYLSAYLTSLKEDGWTVFVVRGDFPVTYDLEPSERSRWLTPSEAKVTLQRAEEKEKEEEAALVASQFASLPQSGTAWSVWQGNGAQGGKASVAPFSGVGRRLDSGDAAPSAPPFAADQDLDAAIALSLAEAEQQELLAALQKSSQEQLSGVSASTSSQQVQSRDPECHPPAEEQEGPARASAGNCPGPSPALAALQGAPPHGPGGSDMSQGSVPPPQQGSPLESDPVASEVSTLLSTVVQADQDPPRPVGEDQGAQVTPESQSSQGSEQPGAASRIPMGVVEQGDAEGAQSTKHGSGSVPEFVELAVRLPSGQRIGRKFLLEDCVAAVEEYFKKEVGNSSFVLAESGPQGKALSDNTKTLGEAGVCKPTLLIVKYKV